MKQTSEMDSVVQQVQDLEAANLKNGVSLGLAEVSSQDSLERAWLLWLNRRRLGRSAVRGLVIGTIVAFLIPAQYESVTRLMPPDPHSGSNSGLAMMAALASSSAGAGAGAALGGSALGGIASDLLGLHDAGAVFTEMLKSRTVQDRIIERFDLRKVYGTRYWVNARKKLTRRTAISADRKSGVITITVTDNDPHRAAQIAQAYVDELDRISAQMNTSAAHRERTFIEQRLTEVNKSLDKAEHDFSEYSSKNATLDIKEQGVAMVEAAAVLQGQMIAAQSELEGLQQIYTENNVRIRSLRARVEELQRQLKKVGGSNPGSEQTNSQEEFPSIRKLPLVGVRWAELYREAKIQETVYELLTEQNELAKIDEAKETPVVKVLDVANVPEKKSFPPRTLLIFLGVLLGVAGGAGWVVGETKWQRMDSTDPRRQLAQEIGGRCVALGSRGKARLQTLWQTMRLGRKRSNDLG